MSSEEYIERLLHKDEDMFVKYMDYSFYAKIPVEDIKNVDLMEELLGNELNSLPEIDDEFNLYINFHHVDDDEYLLELDVYIDGDHYESYFIERINKKKKLIEMIKRIGKYYHWRDDKEIFIENEEKKQKTLFSLLFFHEKIIKM
jgi:hypothetical protein